MPKKETIKKLFDHIAPNYDKLNRIMSFGIDKIWRKKAVRAVNDPTQILHVLDVASGTADFAIDIARKLNDGGDVTGIDLSEEMLSIGRNKIEACNLTAKISLQIGDAENMPFDNYTFHRVSVAFGVRNFENIEQGLSEIYRVLRPYGKLIILELSSPDSPWLLKLYKLYTLHLIPTIGGWISGNKEAYRYLPDSILKFPKPETFVPMLKSIGFEEIEVHNMTFGICRMYVCSKL